MTPEANLEAGGAGARRLQPYVLTFTAPPGLPWDQARLVRLEAEHAAPLPMAELQLDLQRLEAWRPGREAPFAAAYFRRDDVVGEVDHREEIDGRQVRFSVRDERARASARWRAVGPIIGGVVLVAGLSGSILLAMTDRAAADLALEAQRQHAQEAVRLGKAAERRQAESRALVAAGMTGRQFSDVLEDIVWVSRARDPNAAVTGIEWRPDALTVVGAGAQSPIAAKDRQIQPSGDSGTGARWRIIRANPQAGPP